MKIGIIGAGNAGKTLGSAFARQGYHVMLGSRQPEKLADWLRLEDVNKKTILVSTIHETAAFGDLLVHAITGHGAIEALKMAGEENLRGKTLLDISLPINFTEGRISLFTSTGESLGERIQTTFPEVKVVKAMNHIAAAVMVNPGIVANGDHDLFMCGNDAAAKQMVSALLKGAFGWKRIYDLGDLSAAQATEGLALLATHVASALGHGMINFKVAQ
ncbi:NAD(P)-binding domain-containing protein [Paenibacillus chondroitinus]|uniref:NAD(P)-binding domain-containing protein n=1 Tax=Paenibacillus chondroitinus TaxID=59842 RepID=A0ABU6DC95_9BACL|nr:MULTISPECIES: NAD(P)-binding domain-containing protein [Paenibacillus]MCY9656525.1 NAD(P)-binding domain-containing protein [Paenibacillus anseongense]MEB4795349.1 NAD(P)-binding domain-containing protein [Paenibacillus chondroitinus]